MARVGKKIMKSIIFVGRGPSNGARMITSKTEREDYGGSKLQVVFQRSFKQNGKPIATTLDQMKASIPPYKTCAVIEV